MYAQPFPLYGNSYPHWVPAALDSAAVNYACRSFDLAHYPQPRLPPRPAAWSGSAWSNYSFDSDSTSSISNSPVQHGLLPPTLAPQYPVQNYIPTPAQSLASNSTHPRPPQQPPPPTSPNESALSAFHLTNLEPVDASDDPFPVSMQDIIQPKEEIEYQGLSYRFALSTSSGPSSGRNSPSSDDAPDLHAKADRESEAGPSRRKMKVKMHTCELCHKMFPRPSGLKTHMNSHSGDKPFTCPVANCAKSFTVRSNAKRHLRTHGIFPPPPRTAAATGTVDFDTPVVAEEIVHAHFDDRKLRIRWVGDNKDKDKDKDKKSPTSVKAELARQKRIPHEAFWDPGDASRGKGEALSRTLSGPSTPNPMYARTAAPRVVTSAPSISAALGPDSLHVRTI